MGVRKNVRKNVRKGVRIVMVVTAATVVMMAYGIQQATAQATFYLTGSEYHWTRGSAQPLVQQKVRAMLNENKLRSVSDSNKADLLIKIFCSSSYNGETPLFFFATLDATLKIYDKKKGAVVYTNEIRRIKGGGTTQALADDKVYANASQIIADTLARFVFMYTTGKPYPIYKKASEFEVLCDADADIPENLPERKNTYVLIIANDAYSPMQMARCAHDSVDHHARDARVFKEYAIRTMGIPERNVQTIINAKAFEMRREIIRLSSYSKGIQGKAELIFYYAGYGLIDEKTYEPYILPVDIENDDPKFALRISDLYKMLQEDVSKRISIILETSFQFDALQARPAKGKAPKIAMLYPNAPANAILMAAAKPGQTACSDEQAGHGLFTLAILQKLKGTKGKASLKEVSDFVIQNVKEAIIRLKFKEQLPQTLVGSSLNKEYNTSKF